MTKMMKIDETLKDGRYEIDDLLPEGGQAQVAKGVDHQQGISVAIKKLSAVPDTPNYEVELARFQRAGRLRIGHPAVVDPIDMFEEDGEWYTIMPFIKGANLESYVLQNGGRLSEERSSEIMHTLADALEAIHASEIVHRDFKPDNIIITADGSCNIIDLGICKNLREKTLTDSNGLLGTLPWMAPEQISHPGTEDNRTDLYALGAISYYILTGIPPARGQDLNSLAMSICQLVPPAPKTIVAEIPLYLSTICMKLLAKSPNERYQNAKEVLQALNAQSGGMANAYCVSCGHGIGSTANFCYLCGAAQQAEKSIFYCLACGVIVDSQLCCPGCLRNFGLTNHQLVFTTGALTGKRFRIPEGEYAIGRNELLDRDSHISRRHLIVSCSNGSLQLKDAGSTNKTFVGGLFAQQFIDMVTGNDLQIAGNTAIYQN